ERDRTASARVTSGTVKNAGTASRRSATAPAMGPLASTRCGGLTATDAFVSDVCMSHQPPRHMTARGVRPSGSEVESRRATAITPRSGRGSHSALQSQPPSHSPGGSMRARLVMPILAAACVSLLSCDRVPTADRSPGRPSFITDGTLDGNAHPAVVLIIMDVGGRPAFRCSGTIIAPKVVLTAGHCAGEPGEFSGLRIVNEADVQHDRPYLS